MKKILLLFPFIVSQLILSGQTPVPMASQPALTYVETFDSIATWTNNFVSGYGAERFASVPVVGTAAIPDPARITVSSAAWATGSAGGLQKDSANGRLMMLVTGTSNNTSALAFDCFVDFTGINAGTLSFDWTAVFNGATTSNRKGTLKVYATDDGISFSEITAASVTVTNYVAAGGTIANVTLPAYFNNNPNARLRFYYYNAAGGTTGSRPLIALDNIRITASGQPCILPPASATSLVFTNVTATSIQGSFTAASPAPDEYLVIATSTGSLSADPADGFAYGPGDIVGDGTVIYRGSGTSFTAVNLSPQTVYTFYVFSVNIYCNGIITYKVLGPLTGIQATVAGPPCISPVLQPSGLQFGNITTSSIAGSFTGVPDASEYLVVVSANASPGGSPQDGTVYGSGDTVGNGMVVYRGAATGFVATGLNHSTTYHFFVYGLNNFACSNGPVYGTTAPLTGQQGTDVILPCVPPAGDAANLGFSTGLTEINGFFHPYSAQADGYLVIMSTGSALGALPQNGMSYPVGSSLGGGVVVSSGRNYSFSATGLVPNTTHYFFVFSYNEVCIGGPLYRTMSYLSGSAVTTAPGYNFYFGNLHAHSAYSDGNKDHAGLTPADDYGYARNALCMDFLGISEHNHYTSANNPGMLLQYYQQGLSEASGFTASNPGFLALYGMEWGTSANGGHVLVYGVDSLLGWEMVNGSPNYDVFVARNDYLSDSGLFSRVLDFAPGKAFATLAHPSFFDFGNIAAIPWNARADSALAGVAVESGPAFSVDTNYNAPGSSMAFLPYYLHLLAKGYRVAPLIDHDNHNTTFGRTAATRTAVIAPSVSGPDFMQAMNDMRFYATQDCDTRAELLVYGRQMGAGMTHSFPPAITVTVKDPTDTSSVPVIDLMSGVPGSGIPAMKVKSVNGHVLNYTDIALQDSATAYYYADITIAGKRTITAPVWYTRIDTGAIVNYIPQTSGAGNGILIRDNPASDQLHFDLVCSGAGTVVWCVYNLMGQKLVSGYVKAGAGIQPVTLPLGALPAGIYILEGRFDNERIAKKFVHL